MNHDDPIYELSREDLIEVCLRDRMVKQQLAARIGGLMAENCELLVLLNTRDDTVQMPAPIVESED